MSIERNNCEIARLLMQHSVRDDFKDWKGDTSLHKAITKARDEYMVELLLNYNANVDLKDCAGWTPLHLPVVCNSSFVKSLVEYGAQIDLKDRQGRTPLDFAKEL